MRLVEAADRKQAVPVTTAKDFVRLPPEAKPMVQALEIAVEWQDGALLDSFWPGMWDMARKSEIRRRLRRALLDPVVGVVASQSVRAVPMPVDVASALGGRIARIVGPRLRADRTARRNLARAFPEKPAPASTDHGRPVGQSGPHDRRVSASGRDRNPGPQPAR